MICPLTDKVFVPESGLTYSIIIPVHNKWTLTAACLDALSATIAHRRAEGEVIVVDDASTDGTAGFLRSRSDVDVALRHDQNTGFQGAATDGAAAARGEILVFLNNDTTPQPGWLDALIEQLKDPSVGIAGSMFLWPDGRVQEFGGIIWRDGNAYHIGGGYAQSHPIFARARDVDYVSGAGMALRRDFWRELGGFDALFMPAYYEDTDLCMKARAAGKRVVVTPESRIVHLMGGSKDVDPRKSHDTMMSVNREKLRAKWKDVLEREHWPTHPYFVECASDRAAVPKAIPPPLNSTGKNLLFVSWNVPQFDRQAGDRRLYEIMLAYRHQGHAVTLLSIESDDVQARLLGAAGIRVWHGDGRSLLDPQNDTLEARLCSERFDLVYFSSPGAARFYLAFFRNLMPDVPLVTDAVDLAFRRLHRGRVLQDPNSIVALPLDRDWEVAAYLSSDALTSISEEEAAIMRASGVSAPIKLISTFYSTSIEPPPFSARSGVAIVLNMLHAPNLDAIRWFLSDIWPRVLRRKPDMQLMVCGNKTDTLQIQGQIANISITGYLPSMDPVFKHARVNVAPLRVGAGVKGKVTEAMRNGLPTVTTPIGAEGLSSGSADALLVEQDPERFAEAIVAAHEDEVLWTRLSRAGTTYAREHFSREVHSSALDDVLKTHWSTRHSDDVPSIEALKDAFSDPTVGVATFAAGEKRDALARTLRSEAALGAIVGAAGKPRVALDIPSEAPALVITRTAYVYGTRRGIPSDLPQLLRRMQEGGLQIGCRPELTNATWTTSHSRLTVGVIVAASAQPARIASIVSGVKAVANCRLGVVPSGDLSPALPGEVTVSEGLDGPADVRVFDGAVAAAAFGTEALCHRLALKPGSDISPDAVSTAIASLAVNRTVVVGEVATPVEVSQFLQALEAPLHSRVLRGVLVVRTPRQLQLAWSSGITAVRGFDELPARLPGWGYAYAKSAAALTELFAEGESAVFNSAGEPAAIFVHADDVRKFGSRDQLFDMIAPAAAQRPPSVYFDHESSKPPESDVKLLAFYLPQFHPTEENDQWWGPGFTEWHNVAKARQLFQSHDQPHLPGELGFYDLRLEQTRSAQAILAQEHGIHGFIYYHYWFNGRRLLHRPLDEILRLGKPDMPFALCWANENWTRAWDGRSGQPLIVQHYSAQDDEEHIRWLCDIFEDERYIRVSGKPMFFVYRASQLPEPAATAERWRRHARKAGIGDIYLCRVESFPDEHADPSEIGFDASVEFQPDWTNLGQPTRVITEGNHAVFDYAEIARRQIEKEQPGYRRFPGVVPGWDNSPRRRRNAYIFEGNTPEIYGQWLRSAIDRVREFPPDERVVIINAWNEWAEGNHLEPDWKRGRAFLKATRDALAGTPGAAMVSP